MFQDEQDVLMWDLILPSITRSRNNATRNQGAPEGNHNNPNGRRGKTNPETNPIINPETKQIEIEEEIEENNNYLMDYTSNNHEEQFDSINNRGRSGGVIDEDYPSSL